MNEKKLENEYNEMLNDAYYEIKNVTNNIMLEMKSHILLQGITEVREILKEALFTLSHTKEDLECVAINKSLIVLEQTLLRIGEE